MFRIDRDGKITMEEYSQSSHEGRVFNSVETPREDTRMAQLLMPDIVASSLAPTTALCYSRAFGHFEHWCQQNGRSSMPASPETVALFLTTMAVRKKTLLPVPGFRAAIRFYHTIHHPDKPIPSDSDRVALVMNGIKKKFCRPVGSSIIALSLEARHLCPVAIIVQYRNVLMREGGSRFFFPSFSGA